MTQATRTTGSAGRVHVTPAQLRVLELLANGSTYAAIAGQLYLSATTVRSHATTLQRRFGVTNNVSLVLAAVVVGVLSSGDWPVQLTGQCDFDPAELEL